MSDDDQSAETEDGNSLDVTRIQQALAEAGASWQAGETSMTQLSDEERKRYLGYVPEPDEAAGEKQPQPQPDRTPTPDHDS